MFIVAALSLQSARAVPLLVTLPSPTRSHAGNAYVCVDNACWRRRFVTATRILFRLVRVHRICVRTVFSCNGMQAPPRVTYLHRQRAVLQSGGWLAFFTLWFVALLRGCAWLVGCCSTAARYALTALCVALRCGVDVNSLLHDIV